jgi:hypothetical protein
MFYSNSYGMQNGDGESLDSNKYITLSLVLSLNNPQNSKMKFCGNMQLT